MRGIVMLDGEAFAVSEEREVPGDLPIIVPFETELTPAILGPLTSKQSSEE